MSKRSAIHPWKKSFAGGRTLPSQSSGRSTMARAKPAFETSASDADAAATAPAVHLPSVPCSAPPRPAMRTQSKSTALCNSTTTHTTPAPRPGLHAARRSLVTSSFDTPAATCPSRYVASSSSTFSRAKTQHTVTSPTPTTSAQPSRKRTRSPLPALPPSALAGATALPPAKHRHCTDIGASRTADAVHKLERAHVASKGVGHSIHRGGVSTPPGR